MAHLLSAKGTDILAWRAVGDFSATFRQMVLNRMEFCRSDEADALLNGVVQALDHLTAANDDFCKECGRLIEEVGEATEQGRLREMSRAFYSVLYEHVEIYHSAPAFYQFSDLFLQALARSIINSAYASLGVTAEDMPELALIALGPAGRQEFSPYCPLQLMLVHGDTGAGGNETIARFSGFIHEGFKTCGFLMDDSVTPRNSEWRGSLPEWQERLEGILKRAKTVQIIEALRLADMTFLAGSDEMGKQFTSLGRTLLSESSVAVNNIVSRVMALSNGIGIMGGLRLEKSGPFRGLFALRESAMQPLSASLSVLCLIRKLDIVDTPQRIRELLWQRELDVDMAERLLKAWHIFHELRLTREHAVHPDWANFQPLFLDIDLLSAAEQETLRESLETVGTIQRHIGLNFSASGG